MDANWIGILVAALSSLVVGFVWYNPKVFGKVWMDSIGITEEDTKKGNMAVRFIVAFVLAGVIAYDLGMWASHNDAAEQTFMHGAFHAVLNCAKLVLPVIIINALYQQQKVGGIIVDVFYWAVTFAVMGGILYMWPQPEAAPEPEETGALFHQAITTIRTLI